MSSSWCRMGSMSTTIGTDLLERGPFLVELGQRLEESRVAGRLGLLGGAGGGGLAPPPVLPPPPRDGARFLGRLRPALYAPAARAAPRHRRADRGRARRGPCARREAARSERPPSPPAAPAQPEHHRPRGRPLGRRGNARRAATDRP